jgi:peptidoglycan/xylan/chitin deacetylase (PgdA/CDA1 family)
MRLPGLQYSLRCVLFHDISDRTSAFTDGLGVTMSPDHFEARIRFLAQHYTPINLGTFLAGAQGGKLPSRPVLLTFDDAYASVAEVAAPICRKYNVPALFFVSGSLLGNHDLAMDNFLCYIANTFGLTQINAVAREINGTRQPELLSPAQVTSQFLPTLTLESRQTFKKRLSETIGLCTQELANREHLYLSENQLHELPSFGFEIGNHTFSHVHCRILSGSNFSDEIEHNKAVLETVSGRIVRAFSVPYGSVADLTPALEANLKASGHEAAFLVESRTNTSTTDFYHLNRVSVHSTSDNASFVEIEVKPRLRTIRDSVLGRRRPGVGPQASVVAVNNAR